MCRERRVALGADHCFDKSGEFTKAIDIVENLAKERRRLAVRIGGRSEKISRLAMRDAG